MWRYLVGAAGVIGALVLTGLYINGLGDNDPRVRHREIGWGDAGVPVCKGDEVCVAVGDAGVECSTPEGADAEVCTPITKTVCTRSDVPCPALRCRVADVLFDREDLDEARLEDTDQGDLYGRVRVCADPPHGLPFPKLPAKLTLLGGEDGVKVVPYQTGWSRADFWLAAKKSDPVDFDCACGPDCAVKDPTWRRARNAEVVGRNGEQWRGIDAGVCTPVPCGPYLQGRISQRVQEACCATECEGKTCGVGLCGGNCGTCTEGQTCVGYSCVSN